MRSYQPQRATAVRTAACSNDFEVNGEATVVCGNLLTANRLLDELLSGSGGDHHDRMAVGGIASRIDRKNVGHRSPASACQAHRPYLLLKGALAMTTDPHVHNQLAREPHAVHLVVVASGNPLDAFDITACCTRSNPDDLRTRQAESAVQIGKERCLGHEPIQSHSTGCCHPIPPPTNQ